MNKNRPLKEIEKSIWDFCKTLQQDKTTLLWKTYNIKSLKQREKIALRVLDVLKKDFVQVYADAIKESHWEHHDKY